MSGIVGIVNLDGKPIDKQLLQQMTEFMNYRGPDDRNIWFDGHVGFGHTLLRTTSESAREQQPFCLNGQVWIVADARVDSRAELIQKFNGDIALETATDAELILQAYCLWGEACLEHLLGDFAFAIWDKRQQRLFCARDHFGVKPFYYARVGNCLIFGNTLNCLRIHPAVSEELNDLAIADFLLFDFNQELGTTVFDDIQRLPPAYCLTCSGEVLHLKRYWTLPIDGYIRYKNPSDYVEHFKELLAMAVADRLRTDNVGVFMSGGLDSTAVTATAKEILLKKSVPFDLRAYTIVYDRLIPDRERYYSGLVAEALGIPIDYLVADDYKLFEGWDRPELRQPEPIANPLLAISIDQFNQVAANSRVVLTGYGGDPVMYASGSYFFDLLKGLQFGNLVTAIWQYVRSNGRLPPVGFRTLLRRKLKIGSKRSLYPVWLNPDLASGLDLHARWEKLSCSTAPIHPTRSEAYKSLVCPSWPYLFENYDSGVTGLPIEVRYPFFDVRLVNYLLAIPPIPWFIRKELLRVAMRGKLPESVRRRPKTFLAGNPIALLLPQTEVLWTDNFEASPALAKYVDRNAIASISGIDRDAWELWIDLRPLYLAYWLQQLQPINFYGEKYHAVKQSNINQKKVSQSQTGSLR